jgi:hypothetical protein
MSGVDRKRSTIEGERDDANLANEGPAGLRRMMGKAEDEIDCLANRKAIHRRVGKGKEI